VFWPSAMQRLGIGVSMRILVIGAGALGGYFGGCLLRAGRDVTFLVRSHRAEQLARRGLEIVCPHGDFTVPAPTIGAGDIHEPYDVILVGTKSYSLDEAMEHFATAVGPDTMILPILNGMAHIDSLSKRFGADRVLGGSAMISATLDTEGRIVLFVPAHDLVFGELAGGYSDRTRSLMAAFDRAGFNPRVSDVMVQEMWEKWAGLATNAGMTCMMRAGIGDIIAAGGGEAFLRLFDECRAVASASGFPLRPHVLELCTNMFTTKGSSIKASMLRDIERGSATEGEHVIGDLASRAHALGIQTPILDLSRIHLAAYEGGRTREATAA
jgi:2-dehydropantoate 2-reductase